MKKFSILLLVCILAVNISVVSGKSTLAATVIMQEPVVTGVEKRGATADEYEIHYVVNETFEAFNEGTGTGDNTDSLGNTWNNNSHKLGGWIAEDSDALHGKIFQLPNDAATPALYHGGLTFNSTVAPVCKYDSGENSNNKWILKFGMKYVNNTENNAVSIMRFNTVDASGTNNTSGIPYLWVEETEDSSKITLRNAHADRTKRVISSEEWYTFIQLIEFSSTGVTFSPYLFDGTTAYSLDEVTVEGAAAFTGIRPSVVDGDKLYIDNIQLYQYTDSFEKDDKGTNDYIITSVLGKRDDASDIINENFAEFPLDISLTDNAYVFGGNTYAPSGYADINGITLNGGRHVLRLSEKEAASASAQTPTVQSVAVKNNSLMPAYSDAIGISNVFVSIVDFKYFLPDIGAETTLLSIKTNNESEGVEQKPILKISADGKLNIADGNGEGFDIRETWCTLAVTYGFTADNKTKVICTVKSSDSEERTFDTITLADCGNITEFVYSGQAGSVLYLDNLSLYEAEIAAPSVKEGTLSNEGYLYNGRVLKGDFVIENGQKEAAEFYWSRGSAGVGAKITGSEQSAEYILTTNDIGYKIYFNVIPRTTDIFGTVRSGEEKAIATEDVVFEEPAEEDRRAIEASNLGVSDLSNVDSDLLLNTTGAYGSKLVWESNNDAVVGADGTVSRQSVDTTVILTANITGPDPDGDGPLASALRTQTKTVTVKAKASSGGGSGGSGGSGRKPQNITVSEELYTAETNLPIDRPDHKYNDVSNNHWAMDYIQKLYHLDIARGDENNNFNPEKNITREEFTKMLVCAFGLIDETAVVEFEDVGSDDWFYPYVASAYKSLIVNGIGNNKFGTGGFITRQDISVMAYKTMLVMGKEPGNAGNDMTFADKQDVADYAYEAVRVMQNTGIMSGSGNNMFRSSDFATRAEVSKIIVQLINYIKSR